MSVIYNIFGEVLKFCYMITGGNYVLALFVFTLLYRLVMLPFAIKQQSGMARQTRLQPKIAKIQKKYADNKQKAQEEINALYQREGFNPISSMGCLPMLVQLVLIFPLMEVIYKPLTYLLNIPSTTITQAADWLVKHKGVAENLLFSKNVIQRTAESTIIQNVDKLSGSGVAPAVIDKIHNFHYTFFGIPLGVSPSSGFAAKQYLFLLVPALVVLSQFAVSWYTMRIQKKNSAANPAGMQMGCMMYGMPLISVFFCWGLPTGIGIYWIASSLIALAQSVFINRFYSPQKMAAKLLVEETIIRRSRERLQTGAK